MGQPDDRESEVRRLLDELCIKLGFCLSPAENQRLRQSPPGEVDSFTDAVFEAEGISEVGHTDLRRQVRDIVARHLSRWAGTDDQAAGGQAR
ncbi:hypothetical protein [Micromonospora sp. NBS 11-29]|uniref:hypothetical protein n=1 Tax=Micromonospora sp. NBS 11-29 TaxID=1960879 RepID=UPI000B76FAA3|nr:hypothetical protein [Micromonospora sp. NBS 11-29]